MGARRLPLVAGYKKAAVTIDYFVWEALRAAGGFKMICPTIGRVVWFYPAGSANGVTPHAALIAHVHSDTMVNLAAFDGNGVAYNETSVLLFQGGPMPPDGPYCEWMPFQIAQAATQLHPVT